MHLVHIAYSGVLTDDITANVVSIEGSVTWNISGLENVKITIDPHENTKGTVSVYVNQE